MRRFYKHFQPKVSLKNTFGGNITVENNTFLKYGLKLIRKIDSRCLLFLQGLEDRRHRGERGPLPDPAVGN
jgi:hypothetical protein